jgi:hypothetical protein
MESLSSYEQAFFVLSSAILLVLLSFGYGFASNAWELFPHDYVTEAWVQANSVISNVRGVPPDSDPVVFEREGAREVRPDSIQPGLTLISSSWKDMGWRTAVRLFDSSGKVVHEWGTSAEKVDPSLVGPFAGFRNFEPAGWFRLFSDGDLLISGTNVLARLNACGEVLWRTEPSEVGRFHHVGVLTDSTIWFPAGQEEVVSLPGLGKSEVDHEFVVKLSKSGEILKKVSILELIYENNLQDRIFRTNARGLQNGDLTHLNDIEILTNPLAEEYPSFEPGDLLISLREIHSLIVFDPDTEKVKWIESDHFIRQHDPDFLGNGWIGVFDNHWEGNHRGEVLGGSRITAVHTRTDSTRTLFSTSSSEVDTFYTRTAGRWQKLRNGNLLLTESRAGRVSEVTKSGQLVWEWVNQSAKSRVPEVYGARRVDITQKDVASWSCSSVDSVSTAQNQ